MSLRTSDGIQIEDINGKRIKIDKQTKKPDYIFWLLCVICVTSWVAVWAYAGANF